MRLMRRRGSNVSLGLFVLIIVVGAALGACTSGDGDGTGVYEGLLQLVPDSEGTRSEVMMFDIERLRTDRGVAPPADPTDAQQVADYLIALADRDGTPINFLGSMMGIDWQVGGRSQLAAFGFGFDVVDQTVEAGVPPERYFAVRGPVDVERTARLLEACDGCSADDVRLYREHTVYRWGRDWQQALNRRFDPPFFDGLGRGGRVAIGDGYALRTNWTQGIHQMIDAVRGVGPLAGREDFRLAARALDQLGTYNAYLTDLTQGIGTEVPETLGVAEAWSPDPGAPVLEPYAALALGQAIDDEGVYLGVVLVHETEEDATANVALLERRMRETESALTGRPWTEAIGPVIDIGLSGRVLTARVRTLVWIQFLFAGDPLLLHE
jgi:hypothetical protein